MHTLAVPVQERLHAALNIRSELDLLADNPDASKWQRARILHFIGERPPSSLHVFKGGDVAAGGRIQGNGDLLIDCVCWCILFGERN